MIMKEVTISITGAAGQIGYALLFRLASGEIFGNNTRINLQLLELPQALGALEGVKMELDDCAFPQLGRVICTNDLNIAFKDSDWALLVGSVPRKQGMERNDLLKINGSIFTEQGKALDKNAKPTCKVLVVGNPCNTNALIAMSHCRNIPKKNFFAMTRLDQSRAISQLANKAGLHSTSVKKVAIWGNHSSTQYPDFYNTEIEGKPCLNVIGNEKWAQDVFIPTVQQRGAAIIKARGASSAASAASAALGTVKCLINPTPVDDYFSVAVASSAANHAYGITEEVMFSYPIKSNGEDWKVVTGIDHNDFGKEKIQATYQELIEEKKAVAELMG